MSTRLEQMMQSRNNLTSSQDQQQRSSESVPRCFRASKSLLVVILLANWRSLCGTEPSLQPQSCAVKNRQQVQNKPEAADTDQRNEEITPKAPRQLNLPPRLYSYNIPNLPSHFNSLPEEYRAIAESVRIADAVATLGRVLFYDPNLSRNGSISCASCHIQQFAFSDPRRFSQGHDGRKTARQSMSLINLQYSLSAAFFWDARAHGLKQQVLIPIENDVEMGHDLKELIPQLQADPIYPPLFKSAFGSNQISRTKIAESLSQFVMSIVSYRSAYDEGMAKASSPLHDFPNFTAQQNLGKRQFFESGCASCHLSAGSGSGTALDAADFDASQPVVQSAIFQIEKAVVNGIDSDDDQIDSGVGNVTGKPVQNGAFRSPSLRNVEVTGPYMHDGRFPTLDSVVEHYNWSVRPHPNLDKRLHFALQGIAIPEFQKVALVEFLRTLTDHQLLKDPKFSDPFVRR